MRDGKARRRKAENANGNIGKWQEALAKMRNLGLLRDAGKTTATYNKGGIISINVGGSKGLLPYKAMQCISYVGGSRSRHAVAASFGVHPDTVSKVRNLVAQAQCLAVAASIDRTIEALGDTKVCDLDGQGSAFAAGGVTS